MPSSSLPKGATFREGEGMKASSNRWATFMFVTLATSGVSIACGGSGAGAKDGSDVTCPAGQTFDGEFCQVDQSVATAEQPLAGTNEPEEPAPQAEPTEKMETPPEDEADPPRDETEVESTDTPKPTQRTSATPVDVTMAAQAGPIIQYLASSHLPSGARQMGAPFAGQFAPGQQLEQKVQLTEGKCYTVVAAGLPPVAEVNLELFVEGESEPVSKDETTGVQAVLGSRNACFQPSASGPYRLVLWVEKGQGVAAAQVFQK